MHLIGNAHKAGIWIVYPLPLVLVGAFLAKDKP